MATYEQNKESAKRYVAKFYRPRVYFPLEMEEVIKTAAADEFMSVNKFINKAVYKLLEEIKSQK